MLRQMTLFDSTDATSSAESAGGNSLCSLLGGQTIATCGLAVALASRTRPRGKAKATKTREISGPISSGSSASVALTRSLVSRLQARLGTGGSMEFNETWKEKVTPLGIAYWEHTASARRTSGSGCIGWPITKAKDSREWSPNAPKESASGHGLGAVSNLTLWPTPKANEKVQSPEAHEKGFFSLEEVAGWASPASRDFKDTPGMSDTGTNPDGSTRTRLDQLPRQVHGLIQSQSPALTAARAGFRLNPAMSRWLMGFPSSWDRFSPGWDDWDAMQRLLREWRDWLAETERGDCEATATR